MKKHTLLLLVMVMILLLTSCTKPTSTPVESSVEPVESAETTPPVETEPAKPQELTTVRINMGPQLSFAPIFFAETEGYFAEYGIKIELVELNRSSAAVPLLVSGDLDAYAGTINAGFLNTLYLEPNIRIVADRGRVTAAMDCTNQGVVVRKDLYENGAVRGPEDLKGLKMVISAANPSTFLIAMYMQQAGLTFADIEATEIPSTAYLDAMAGGNVDVISTVEPTLSRLLAAGDSVLLATMEDVVGDLQSSVLAFGKRLLVDDPELGARFLAAYMKGVAQYNEGKTEHNLQILAEKTGLDIEEIKNSCWLPINEDGIPQYDSIVPFMDWSIREGYLEHAITEEQFWNPEPLEKAMKLLED